MATVSGPEPPSVQRLIDKLHHDNQQVALATVHALGELGERATPALPDLMLLYLGHSHFVRHTVAHTLAKIGQPAVEVLLPCLSDPRADVRLQTARILAWIGPAAREANDDLLCRLDDPNQAVREAIVNALARINA